MLFLRFSRTRFGGDFFVRMAIVQSVLGVFHASLFPHLQPPPFSFSFSRYNIATTGPSAQDRLERF